MGKYERNILIVKIPHGEQLEIVNANKCDVLHKVSNSIEFISENLCAYKSISYIPNGEIVIRFKDDLTCYKFIFILSANYDILIKGGI